MQAFRLQCTAGRYALRPSYAVLALRVGQRTASTGAKELDDGSKAASVASLTAKWQPHWDKLAQSWDNLSPRTKGNAYVLPMFPYPSGSLHLGHLRVYTISDVIARFKHMQGYKVLHPIAWDAFGLPAENAAIERGVHPKTWTLQNIETMKQQIKDMGGRWNWETEFLTCDPTFYKHTQRIFLMLYQRGLAYQAESLVNYDPVDKTVLANEQVDINGCSWRSGAKVEKIMLKQWFLKIKDFQDSLLDDLDDLSKDNEWPDRVLAMQRKWIGKSKGAKLPFDILSARENVRFEPVQVFTTRADTIFGVHYVALSIRHPIVQRLATDSEPLRTFLERARHLPLDTKEGFLLPDVFAKNPIAAAVGTSPSSLPVYAAPYVLDDYGSGAVMGVPGHDSRDHAFWRYNAGDSLIDVVVSGQPNQSPAQLVPGDEDRPNIEPGYLATNLGRFGNMPSEEAAHEVVETLRKTGVSAEHAVSWRLRDWLISRQRYWGTPIPIVHCDTCGSVPVDLEDLPVELPHLPDHVFKNMKGNPLAQNNEWKKTTCPRCGAEAERETDTMDTFMDSSWYFYRFLDPNNTHAPVDAEKASKDMPVDVYIGGIEHAILHLLYARFVSKFLASTMDQSWLHMNNGEPFKQLITQGMVYGRTYTDPNTGQFLHAEEIDTTDPLKPLVKAINVQPQISYEKMSKSKRNGIDPIATIAEHGVDATRLHTLFQAPVGEVLEWDSAKIVGSKRFLERVLRLSTANWIPKAEKKRFMPPQSLDDSLFTILRTLFASGVFKIKPATTELAEDVAFAALKPEDVKLWTETQQTIASVTESYKRVYPLNTVVSDLMTLSNAIYDSRHAGLVSSYIKYNATIQLIRMLAPIAPSVAEEAWHVLIHTCFKNPYRAKQQPVTIFAAGFPLAQLEDLSRINPTLSCVVQIDGKRKFDVKIERYRHDGKAQTNYDLIKWVLKELLKTQPGMDWLDRNSGKIWKMSEDGMQHSIWQELPEGWKIIVVKGGALVNLVSPRAVATHEKRGETMERGM